MIRPARMMDIPALEGLVRREYATSKFVGRVEISDKALKHVLQAIMACQLQSGVGATCCFVAEHDDRVTGFIAGSLARIYNIGTKLAASDAFFINEGRPRDAFALLDSYVAWARANPKVLLIGGSWTDAIEGAYRVGCLFERKGFARVGEQWEMRLDEPAMEAAA
jgi:hypothetical protein